MERELIPTVKHNISKPDFSYDMIRGIFNKGSIVSKSIHPIEEVETLKRYLVERGYLVNRQTCWAVKKPISTGLLMAVNLHFGTLVKKNPFTDAVYVENEIADELEGKLPEKDLWISDSPVASVVLKDIVKVKSIFEMHINGDFLVNQSSDSFGQDERFVFDILQEHGIISSDARHGLTKENEADIVDEVQGQQYEITYEVKNSLANDKTGKAVKHPEMLIVQMVNNPYIHPSDALLKKLYNKQYTPKYTPNLVILNCGSVQTTQVMLEALCKRIDEEGKEFKTDFKNIYIITQDFISEEASLVQLNPPKSETFPCSNQKMGFISLRPCSIANMQNDHQYLALLYNVFNKREGIRYASGQELHIWFKEMHML